MLRITGKIYTGRMDAPTTDAVLVGDDGKIVAVGEGAKQAHAEAILLGDRVAVPGFIDAHMHLEGLAQQLTQLLLSDATSLDDALERVRERCTSSPEDEVVFGTAWDESDWADPAIPDREAIDTVAPGHAVVLRRVCGHLWVVNSKALERIAARDDLTGAQRERLGAVSADGMLREGDIALAAPLAAQSPERMKDGLREAMRHALSLGATGLQDMGSLTLGKQPRRTVGNVIDCLSELDRAGELPVRVVVSVRLSALDEDDPAASFEGLHGTMLHPGPVKIFLDGSIGAQTAAISEPFTDDPGNTGQLLWDEGELERVVERLHLAGCQLALHAIGDRAIRQALDVLGQVLARHPRRDHRHRIEHLEIVGPEQLERMGDMVVIASMQPNFVGRWHTPGGLYEKRLGAARTGTLNPLRSILEAGVPLAFGSDGMPFGPLYGVRSAIEHATRAERLTFAQALHAYTLTAAFAGRIEHLTGSVEAGKQADLAVLSADPADAGEVRVEEVFVAGRRRFPF
ncbi:MAG TPA: amidohydrolase [Planctomycetota bacterium]|nr:amidohydrolase [Planctomycetota bacterium]